MSQPLLENLTLIQKRIADAAHLLVGLEYDGALTPIVADPSKAKLSSETRKRLKSVAARPRTSVAIVSGRGLQDVRGLVGMDNLIYAGNHGLEIAGPGLCFVEPTAVKMQRSLGWLAAALTRGLSHIAGAMVENKSLTIAVHYRQAPPADKKAVLRHVQAAVGVAPHRFRVSEGNQVFDLLPPLDWHKGSALRWIADQLKKRNLLTLYVGDDRTDEIAFGALSDGITVKVGAANGTAAAYQLDGPDAVREFLFWLANLNTQGEQP